MITKTWYDPCPRCGGEVTGVDYAARTIRSNPDSLTAIPDPGCPHLADPDADCTCIVLPNPVPDPMFDEEIVIGGDFTMHPCGDVIHAGRGGLPGWKMYQQQIPEPES